MQARVAGVAALSPELPTAAMDRDISGLAIHRAISP